MPVSFYDDSEGQDGTPHPPVGFNYRLVRRRTNYYRRATQSMSVADGRFANLLVAMSTTWLSLMMQNIIASVQFLHELTSLPVIDETQCQRDRILQDALMSFTKAIVSQRMVASIFIDVRRLLFYIVDNLDPDSILARQPKRFRSFADLDDASSYFLTGFLAHHIQLMFVHL